LTWAIADAVESYSGFAPYVVVANFDRSQADVNRGPDCGYEQAAPYGTCNPPEISGGILYDGYHQKIEEFVAEILDKFGGGLLVDVHRNGKSALKGDLDSSNPIEWGYLDLGTRNSSHSSLEELWMTVDDRQDFIDALTSQLDSGFEFYWTGNFILDLILALSSYSSRVNAVSNEEYPGAYTVGHYDADVGTIQFEFNSRIFGSGWGDSPLDPVDRSRVVAINVGQALAKVYSDLVEPKLP